MDRNELEVELELALELSEGEYADYLHHILETESHGESILGLESESESEEEIEYKISNNCDKSYIIRFDCCKKYYCCEECHPCKIQIKEYKIKCENCDEEQIIDEECNRCGIKFDYCTKCNKIKGDKKHCTKCKECHEELDRCITCKRCYKDTHTCDTMKGYINQEDCMICLETLKNGLNKEIGCRHKMHYKCYNELIKYSNKCPLCRI